MFTSVRFSSEQSLLRNNENGDLESNGLRGKVQRFLTPRNLVLGALCVLALVLLVVFLTIEGHAYINGLPGWPKPSRSLLGEYSKAAVAADNELCSDIGRDILLQGGNAVDAAIATLFCIGVMGTQSAGIGGGHFMTIYNATTKKCHVVDAREVAPLAAFENMYKDRWNMSKFGWEAMAVPGEVHGMWTEYSNFASGRVPWSDLVHPTIKLMEEGYPTSFALAHSLKEFEAQILAEPTMKRHFVNPETDKIYQHGEQITTRKNLVETFKRLAASADPVKEFYRSDLTAKIIEEFQKNGGLLTLKDFARYSSRIRADDEVIYTEIDDGRRFICGPPPPSGSAATQAILNIMNGMPRNTSTFDDNVNLYHRFLEASKFAYAQRSELGDMAYVGNATEIAKRITSPEWADHIRAKITDETHPDDYYGGNFYAATEDHGTTHISVVDKYGNAVSVTSTINLIFGSMRISESSGVLWNDQMDDFSLPGHPNYYGYPPTPANFIRPGKRPMSSTSPLIIFDTHSKDVMAIGGAGGSLIISSVADAALRTLWLGYDVKQAIDMPRLHNQLKPNVTYYEPNWPSKYIDALKERGHHFESVSGLAVLTAIRKLGTGAVYANSDFRKGPESEPAGY